MCADDDVGEPHLEFPENHLAFRGGGGAYEQPYVQACRIEERLEALVVLPRENVRRHHQRALFAHPRLGDGITARAAYGHHREHGDHGLPAADVALQ